MNTLAALRSALRALAANKLRSVLTMLGINIGVAAVITMIAMPLTFSIAEGIALGFVAYIGFSLLTGRARTVTPLAHLLGLLFLAHLIFR